MATSDAIDCPTVLDEKTCVRKGLCPMGQSQGVPSYNIYYEIHGSLDATHKLVFIMGLNNTCFGWSNQVEYFGKKPDHAVLVFDNRGVGNSDTGSMGPYKSSGMAQDVVDLLDFVGWNHPRSLDLIGVSMGGMILQELCLLIPKRIISAVFASTRAGEQVDLSSLGTVLMIGRSLLRKASPEERISHLVRHLFPAAFLDEPASDGSGRTNREVKQEVLFHHSQKRRPPSISGVVGQLSAVMTHRCTADVLARLAAEVSPAKLVVLTGAADAVLASSDSIALHSYLPGAELVVWDDGGHALCSQMPERHNLLIERAMREGREAIAASSLASTA